MKLGSLPKISFETLFENAPCGYLATDLDGTIIQINETFQKLTGYSKEWVLNGKRFSHFLTVSGKIFCETHLWPLINLQGFVHEIAFDFICSNGNRLSTLVNAAQVKDPSTGELFIFITVLNAKDRRVYEEELLTAKQLADSAKEAEAGARKKAELASNVKDEFLTIISHELRTPLNAILGWAQLLQQDPAIDEKQMRGLSVIERNARMQAQLIEDLLDMGRISAGKMRLDIQQVPLSEVIEAAMDTAKPSADSRRIALSAVLDPSILVHGDANRLQQVFWNLLTNAIKFTPEQGFVRVIMQRVGSEARCSVVDSGKGMSQDFMGKAFERFSQSEGSDSRPSMGLGLGLSIVKNIVEMHGGAVTVQSEGLDKGSTFIVQIPTAVSKDREGRDAVIERFPHKVFNRNEYLLKSIKVLVLDDHKDARDLALRLLSESGAEVFTAASTSEALLLMDQVRPDILVSDIALAGDNGNDFLKEIRSLKDSRGQIPAIALTGFTRPEDQHQAMQSGFQTYLIKPVDARELVMNVASLVGK